MTLWLHGRQKGDLLATGVPGGQTVPVRDEALVRACDVANRDEDVVAMEREFDAIAWDVAEPWNRAPGSLSRS
jgi:hypothetical protein